MNDRYDLVIVGGGPAGLAAAIYMARARYRVLVVEKDTIGGQITITSEVVNYPGIRRTSGKELTEEMRLQAEGFGAEFMIANVTGIKEDDIYKIVETSNGSLKTLSVLIAAGASPRKLGFEGEKEFQGRGVAYCATCDGEFFTGKDVFVIGGSFAAAEEAVFLTKYAKQVTIVMRGEDFRCAKATADAAKNHPKIKIKYQTEVTSVGGSQTVDFARFYDKAAGESWEHQDPEGFGVFVFAGYEPASQVFRDIVEVNEHGYILTDRNQRTNKAGIYAAGDICVKDLRQVVTAVADGAAAATDIEKYAASLYEAHDLEPIRRPEKNTEAESSKETDGSFLTADMIGELKKVFAKFPQTVLIKFFPDHRPVSQEAAAFLKEVTGISDKLQLQVEAPAEEAEKRLPSMEIWNAGGNFTGISFHGVPGGHEFNSFIMALYYASEAAPSVPDELKERTAAIQTRVNLKIVVSLSCTMCPALVLAAERLAAANDNIETEVFDLTHYPDLRDKYHIMSVPCMLVNDEHVHFGKKEMPEILDIIEHI